MVGVPEKQMGEGNAARPAKLIVCAVPAPAVVFRTIELLVLVLVPRLVGHILVRVAPQPIPPPRQPWPGGGYALSGSADRRSGRSPPANAAGRGVASPHRALGASSDRSNRYRFYAAITIERTVGSHHA